jgi:hypothetical protein
VHGTPSRALVWRDVAAMLARKHTVYCFDLLGFGDSERHVDQDVSLVAHGEVLAELVGYWGLERPALVGHDIGGAAVLRSATARELEPAVFAALFGQWEDEHRQRLYVRNFMQLDEEHTAEFEPRLATMEVPALVVWGEDAPGEVAAALGEFLTASV